MPSIYSPTSASLRDYLASHSHLLLALDTFLLSLRLGEFNNPSYSDTPSRPNEIPGSPSFRSTESGELKEETKEGRKVSRSALTLKAMELVRSIVGTTKWTSSGELLIILEALGRLFHSSYAKDPCLSNTIRRLMNLVRTVEEDLKTPQPTPGALSVNTNLPLTTDPGGVPSGALSPPNIISRSTSTPSMTSALISQPQNASTDLLYSNLERFRSDSMAESPEPAGVPVPDGPLNPSNVEGIAKKLPPYFFEYKAEFRQMVMEGFQEVIDDLEEGRREINEQAGLHIHSNEIILTYSLSRTIEIFLLHAHQREKRQFHVIIAEGAPHFGGHVMANKLSSKGVRVTVINDSAITALMPRVNLVLLPAHAILANGGVVAPSGSHLCALSALANKVPTVVVSSLTFKLCPMYPHEGQDIMQDFVSPAFLGVGSESDNVDLICPVHDYIPPELIKLFITNVGGVLPSYVYRLLSEVYCVEDPIIFK
ncbi:hypothetical protein TrST_g10887 [Triparma strigata]|uniref:Translation initiation factor eIF2B subunit beta n=1 Tax=Triparma strigata TaxID=1606541 RepID=A0A9W7DVQ4_9STRA|nr:hypothetical protein TrST_g10887 [Triparma strigata]